MQERILHRQVVLIVGDDPLSATGLDDGLENTGAEVARVTLQGAQEVVQQRSVSAVVLDCCPASGERRTLVRLLRRRGVPFLSYGVEPPADVTTEQGAPFVAKPCPAEKITAAVRYLLRPL